MNRQTIQILNTCQCKPSLNEISSKVEKQTGTVKMEKIKELSFKGNLNGRRFLYESRSRKVA